MKNKETLSAENRALKNLNARSTDIITQLKDAEKKVRDLVVGFNLKNIKSTY